MNEPRPAMISARPPESRSTVAKSWKTRTGASELSTVTALVRRIRSVRTAAAPGTTAGGEAGKAGGVVLSDADAVDPQPVGELDLLHQVAQPLCGVDRLPALRIRPQLGEG